MHKHFYPPDGFPQLKMKNIGFVKVHAGFPAKKKNPYWHWVLNLIIREREFDKDTFCKRKYHVPYSNEKLTFVCQN